MSLRLAHRIEGVRLTSFGLPLMRSIGGLTAREGLLVALYASGKVGVGEVAPWPGLNVLTVHDAQSRLAALGPSLVGRALPAAWNDPWDRFAFDEEDPCISWAITSAAMHLAAELSECSLATWLRPDAAATMRSAGLLLDDSDLPCLPIKARCIKVKLRNPHDLRPVAAVRDRYPRAQLRVDANRSWTLDEARAVHDALLPLGIQFFEEPVAAADLPQLLQTGMPVALDESLTTVQRQDDPRIQQAAVLVLKPSYLGTTRVRQLLRTSRPVVFSSPFESVVGRTHLAHLQAALGGDLDPGLGTHRYLAADLGTLEEATGDIPIRRLCADAVLAQTSTVDQWGACRP